MLDSFDPTGCRSPRDVIASLNSVGISLGHRAAARVLALGHRGVRLSLALLEAMDQEESTAALMARPDWSTLPEQLSLAVFEEMLKGEPVKAVEQEGVFHLITLDEASYVTQALVHQSGQDDFLPQVLGGQDPGSFTGLFWDRHRLEEASLKLMDAEDPTELIESFRYLFRALTTQGVDPNQLLTTALSRGKSELSLEVARQVQQHFSRELGGKLEALLQGDFHRQRTALEWFLKERGRPWQELSRALLPPLVEKFLRSPEHRSLMSSLLGSLLELFGVQSVTAERLLGAQLDVLSELSSQQRAELGRALQGALALNPGLTQTLMLRWQEAVGPEEWFFFARLLSDAELEPEQRSEVCQRLVERFSQPHLDTVSEERLPDLLLGLGDEPLLALCTPERFAALPMARQLAVFSLWERHPEPPDPDPLVARAVEQILAQEQDFLVSLARSGQLLLPPLVAALAQVDLDINYLLQQAYRLEPPDDEPIFRLLDHLEGDPVAIAFERFRREAALGSPAAPHRLYFMGRLVSQLSADKLKQLPSLVEQVLEFSWNDRELHPNFWLGLGELAVESLEPEQVARLHTRIMAEWAPHTAERLRGAFGCLPFLAEEPALAYETRLREHLVDPKSERTLVKAVLAELEQYLSAGGRLLAPLELVGALCRSVLAKSQEQSMRAVIRRAMQGEGDGMVTPQAWDREDRDMALKVMGALACCTWVEARLFRMLVVRLSSFALDWLEGIANSTDVYTYRETPLWELLDRVLHSRLNDEVRQAFGQVGLRVWELSRKCPELLNLSFRESLQRFLVSLIEFDLGAETRLGSLKVDLPASLLTLLTELEAVEEQLEPASHFLLEELSGRTNLREPLQSTLDRFLS